MRQHNMPSRNLCLILLAIFGASSTADADCPNIITRGEWGGKDPKNITKLATPVSHVMIHQTVTWPCRSLTRCSADVRGIQTNHMEVFGLDDIGYSFLIGGDGNVYEGRGWNSVGVHTLRWNDKSVAIAFMGYYQTAEPSSTMLNAAHELIACGKSLGKLRDDVKVLGPGQFQQSFQNAPNIGPGDSLYNHVKTWPEWSATP